MTKPSSPMVATSERTLWIRQLLVSMKMASPRWRSPAHRAAPLPTATDHEPMSLQPTTGIIAACIVFHHRVADGKRESKKMPAF